MSHFMLNALERYVPLFIKQILVIVFFAGMPFETKLETDVAFASHV